MKDLADLLEVCRDVEFREGILLTALSGLPIFLSNVETGLHHAAFQSNFVYKSQFAADLISVISNF